MNSKPDKFGLKLIGINNSSCSDEEVLEYLSEYVSPSSIKALLFDSHNNFYTVFVSDIDSFCKIMNKKIVFGEDKVEILPLLDFYIVNNVYPTLSDEDVADIFRTFGNVYEVKNHKILPNSSKFSHILSGKREISFLLPGKDKELTLPTNVISLPHTFHVSKYCCACLTVGHSALTCPEMDEDIECQNLSLPSFDGSDFEEDTLGDIVDEKDSQLDDPPIFKSEMPETDFSECKVNIESMENELNSLEAENKNILPPESMENELNSLEAEDKNILPPGKFRVKITPRREPLEIDYSFDNEDQLPEISHSTNLSKVD